MITDLLTETFGRRYAQYVVNVCVFCSLLVMLLLSWVDSLDAVSWSPVDKATFSKVFQCYGYASFASLVAIYIGQSFDIFLFTMIKKLTGGRYLWIRNTVSTICAQWLDTVVVISLLCFFDLMPWDSWFLVIKSSLVFKWCAAVLDTPFCYLGRYLIKKYI